KSRYASLNVFFLMPTLVAPLCYSALSKKAAVEGSLGTLFLASWLTIWGVFGQLAAMALVVGKLPEANLSAGLRGLFFALLVAAFLLTVIYAWRTLYALVALQGKEDVGAS